jgi:hypothetical protein
MGISDFNLQKKGCFIKKFPKVSFKDSILSMKISVKEQVGLIVLSVISLILKEGTVILVFTSPIVQFILSVLIITYAIAAIQIMLDTVNTVFDFMSTEDEISK